MGNRAGWVNNWDIQYSLSRAEVNKRKKTSVASKSLWVPHPRGKTAYVCTLERSGSHTNAREGLEGKRKERRVRGREGETEGEGERVLGVLFCLQRHSLRDGFRYLHTTRRGLKVRTIVPLCTYHN